MTTVNTLKAGHPRPDFERTDWLSLNGDWKFDFDDLNIGEKEKWYNDKNFSREITVPFCYQSKLSGINLQEIHEIMWYRTEFNAELKNGKRVILHFGAVDRETRIWINGKFIGGHCGGYTPFQFDITNYIKNGSNLLVVRAEDCYDCDQPRGKQYWKKKPDRCWYTATSGIWQSVWIEYVGEYFIDSIKITPDIDNTCIKLEINTDRFCDGADLDISIRYEGKQINRLRINAERTTFVTMRVSEIDNIDDIHLWSPENPCLYTIDFSLIRKGEIIDCVKSYFGLRKISVRNDVILINNKPYYQKLILDQGYWPDSLLTPPSDDAIKFDIEMVKKLGFNGVRKHQKIEDPRFYYWADKLGILVWGELPSAYCFNNVEVKNLATELTEFIRRDYNHPSIITWVPLNESWGVRNIYSNQDQQRFATALYHIIKAMDPMRLISTNDGWEMVDSDICGIHDYEPSGSNFEKRYQSKENIFKCGVQGKMLIADSYCYKDQPVLITEYGGIAFKSECEENWGYFESVANKEEFIERYKDITLAIKKVPYIKGYCYTELTDVMQEVNGLMTADRVLKVSAEDIKKINDAG